MPGVNWIEHKGKRIFHIDFRNSNINDINATIEQAKPLIAREPQNSILCLVDTTGSRFSTEVADALKQFTLHNKPYMKVSALVGIEGLQKVILNGVILFTGRKNLVTKNSREEALDWLATPQ